MAVEKLPRYSKLKNYQVKKAKSHITAQNSGYKCTKLELNLSHYLN